MPRDVRPERATRARAATAKVVASITNAGATPTTAMSAPASAGPMSPMIWLEPWITAFAGASIRPGTSIGMIVLRAG